MKALLYFLVLAALAAAATTDVDVTGKWSGSLSAPRPDGETKAESAVLLLKQTGAEITGTVGPNEDEQFPIQKGKIDGDKITLEADHKGQTIKIALVLVAADRITGEVQMSREGETVKAKLDVSRAK